MSAVLLVAADAALLEGVAQAIGSLGYELISATSLAHASAVVAASASLPAVAIVARGLLVEAGDLARVPLTRGGAIIAVGSALFPLPAAVQRQTIAEVEFPAERARLLALVRQLQERERELALRRQAELRLTPS